MMLSIIGTWMFLMIIALCFKNYRAHLKSFGRGFVCECNSLCKETCGKEATCLEYLLILFIALILLLCSLFFLLLLPFFSMYFIWRDFSNTDENNAWLKKEREREESYQRRLSKFKKFHYPGIVPFGFDTDTYIYVENCYDEILNQCIQENLHEIEFIFYQNGFRFIYLPQWKPDTSLNRLANLTENECKSVEELLNSMNTIVYTKLLCRVLHFDWKEMESGIFHFAGFIYDSTIGVQDIVKESRFTLYPMQGMTKDDWKIFFSDYCAFIKEDRQIPHGPPCMSVVSKLHGGEFSERMGKAQQNFADLEFPIVMKNIAENIKKEIEILKGAGYYELLLHTIGTDTLNELNNVKLVPDLSRLQITDDFRFCLLDYNKEVRMTPLQKTLYLFYLRHPEGVEFKMLSAYYDELLAIYKVLSNREDSEKQEESIRRLVDVTDNAINEKCSRIKEAFLKVADDFIAKNYYIVLDKHTYKGDGEKTNYIYVELLKKIILPRSLVIYPKEISDIEVLAPEKKKKIINRDLEEIEEQYRLLNRLFFDNSYPKGALIEKYTAFINLNPKYYVAYRDRAVLYTHVGKYREAIADNQLLITHNERVWSDAVINKAEALFFQKDYDEALSVANHYFTICDEPTAECYRIRAEIFRKLKMRDEYKMDMRAYKRLRKAKK